MAKNFKHEEDLEDVELDNLDNVQDPFEEKTIEEKKENGTKEEKNKIGFGTYLKIGFVFLFLTILLWAVLLLGIFMDSHGFVSGFKKIVETQNLPNILMLGFFSILFSVILYIYFGREKTKFITKTKNIIMIYVILIISCVASLGIGKIQIYLRPFAICAMLSVFLLDKRDALVMNSVYCVMMVLIDCASGELMFSITLEEVVLFVTAFISGIISIFILEKEGSRFKTIMKGFIISIPAIVCSMSYRAFNSTSDIWFVLIYSLVSGVLTSSLVLILLPFLERIFGVATNFRLMELVDHKAKLLVELQKKAPGTYNHSILVATLAEACADAIGENALLTRACAYYHDVGKIKNSEYFAENQSGVNPHDDITPELSVSIIREHTVNGAEIIRKFHFPEIMADVALQHHGTLFMRYFLKKASLYTDSKLRDEDYCYEGPKPQSKIAAVIMICDASEASVRTITDRSYENVVSKVQEIIDERMEYDQFNECGITMKDLEIIRLTIVNTLSGIYHDRIKYPIFSGKKKDESKDAES